MTNSFKPTRFGQRLFNLRIEMGIPQRVICNALQIGRGHYSNLENGAILDPRMSTIMRLAKFYNVPTSYFLDGS